MWVAFHEAAHKNRDWFAMLNAMKACGVKWLAIRAGEQAWKLPGFIGSTGPFSISNLRDACDVVGIELYTWAYNYPKPESFKAQMDFIGDCLFWADGHIVDAEIEWTGKHIEAAEFVKMLEDNFLSKDKHVSHCPLAWLQFHPNWPYRTFNRLVQTHPQLYWTELNQGKYKQMADGPMEQWEREYDLQYGVFDTNKSLGTYAPIGCTYGNESVFARNAPGKIALHDIDSFLERASGYETYSLYSWEAAAPQVIGHLMARHTVAMEAEAKLRESADLAASGIVNSSEVKP
jgi:hypothetical protein